MFMSGIQTALTENFEEVQVYKGGQSSLNFRYKGGSEFIKLQVYRGVRDLLASGIQEGQRSLNIRYTVGSEFIKVQLYRGVRDH